MDFQELYDKALERGEEEARKCIPVPMVVYETAGLSNHKKEGGQEWFVAGGVCGFAWVWFPDGRSSVCNFFRKNEIGSKHYRGGYHVWCPLRTQSMQIKESWARGFVEVFQDADIECFVQSRLD